MSTQNEFPYFEQIEAFTNILNGMNTPYASRILKHEGKEYLVAYHNDQRCFIFTSVGMSWKKNEYIYEFNLIDFLNTQHQRHINSISAEDIYFTVKEAFELSICKHYANIAREETAKIKSSKLPQTV